LRLIPIYSTFGKEEEGKMDVQIKGIEDMARLGREFPKAAARTLNKTATHVRAEMAKDARERYNVKSADVKRSMGSLSKATPSRLRALFRAKGKRMALTYFMTASAITRTMQQAGIKIKRRKPVSFTVSRGKKQMIPGSFVAKMKSGHIGVFKRTNATPLPIQEKTGPATSQMLSGAFTRMKDTYEFMARTMKHEVEWMFKGKGGGE
jgi:hypothetical protein